MVNYIFPESRPPVATTFELFPKLPLELRRMIWNFAQPTRYLRLESGTCPWYDDNNELIKVQIGSHIIEPLWILNAVCRESRSTAMGNYRVAKCDVSRRRLGSFSFNPNRDLLHITATGSKIENIASWSHYINDMRDSGVSITKLLVDVDVFIFREYEVRWEYVAKIFQSMQELVFVLGTGPVEKSKVVTPGNIHIGGHLWARSNPHDAQRVYLRLRTVMAAIKEVVDAIPGAKVPLYKVMVMAST